MDIEEVNSMFSNNFVDILVHPKWSLNFPFSSFAEELSGYKRLDFIPRTTEVDENGEIIPDTNDTLENFDVLSLAEKVINATSHSEELKENLKNTVRKIYENVLKANVNEYEN